MLNNRILKFLIILTVALATIYPQAELTRYIIINNTWIGAPNVADNWAEIGFMWFFWLMGLVFLNWILNYLMKNRKTG
ncbi:MAG: hypothetical protein WC329_01695 [Candidatus Omnitrophota bacterium]|jgi:hypothetical protein